MSGGVDSAVAAALLVRQGYDVVGVTLNVWPRYQPAEQESRHDACCSLAAVDDARRVADTLGLAHYTLNFRDIFEHTVIEDFVAEYRRGRTPNPCIRCNEHVKFGALLRRALALDADFIATGHYARVTYDAGRGRYLLLRGVDAGKDQSYALYTLTQQQLSRVLFPLGGLRKEETRALAREYGLPVAAKAESQEICFVPDDDYGTFLACHGGLQPLPGAIVDVHGRVLGRHRGVAYYTIGQRRGLGLATGRPLYVVAVDAQRNEIVVGSERDLYADELRAERVNLIAEAALAGPTKVTAKIRSRSADAEAEVSQTDGGELLVRFSAPQRAITPGQAVVLYLGRVVLGGGTIASVVRSSTAWRPQVAGDGQRKRSATDRPS